MSDGNAIAGTSEDADVRRVGSQINESREADHHRTRQSVELRNLYNVAV